MIPFFFATIPEFHTFEKTNKSKNMQEKENPLNENKLLQNQVLEVQSNKLQSTIKLIDRAKDSVLKDINNNTPIGQAYSKSIALQLENYKKVIQSIISLDNSLATRNEVCNKICIEFQSIILSDID